MIGIILTFIVIIIITIAFFVYTGSKTKKNGIILFGLCDAGKTLIFSRLLFKKFIQTHTSIKENVDNYRIGNVVFSIIDIPGHERLRAGYFDQFKVLAKGLVFVIDSVTVQRDIKDVAEFLYNCLIDNYVAKNLPPLLILCNKQKEVTAKGSTVIKMLLEKEINILRTTKSNQLESLGKNSSNNVLGKIDKDFDFSQLSPMKIDFADCYAYENQNEDSYNVKELESWIQNLI